MTLKDSIDRLKGHCYIEFTLNMKYYFAYGSNLHPMRLEDRVGKADLFGKGKLKYAELLFNKAGSDGSGKATIHNTSKSSNKVFGAIYKISKEQEKLLDKFESLGKGYHKILVEVETENGAKIPCFTYLGMPEYLNEKLSPFHWYKELVVLGGEYLHFPSNYIKNLKKTESVSDQNEKRAATNRRLIELMKTRNSG